MVNSPSLFSYLHKLGAQNDGSTWDFTKPRRKRKNPTTTNNASLKKKQKAKKESKPNKKSRRPVTDFLAKDTSKPAEPARDRKKSSKNPKRSTHTCPQVGSEPSSIMAPCSPVANEPSLDSVGEVTVVYQPPVAMVPGWTEDPIYYSYPMPYHAMPMPAVFDYHPQFQYQPSFETSSPLPVSPTTNDLMPISPSSSAEFLQELPHEQPQPLPQLPEPPRNDAALPFLQLSQAKLEGGEEESMLLLSELLAADTYLGDFQLLPQVVDEEEAILQFLN
jgi:hypothetical protein